MDNCFMICLPNNKYVGAWDWDKQTYTEETDKRCSAEFPKESLAKCLCIRLNLKDYSIKIKDLYV